MRNFALASLAVLAGSLIFAIGCAQQNTGASAAASRAEALPGVSAYYDAATQHHVRPFRKTYRDQRVEALRNLAAATDRLLDESSGWDSDARLISLAAAERDAKRGAVTDFRESLRELQSAASRNDLALVKANYARASKAYRTVSDLARE